MENLRNKLLQRNIARLILVISLFLPLQMSFACQLMDGNQSALCCCVDNAQNGCEHGGGCDNHFSDSSGDKTSDSDSNCCQVNLDSPNQNLVSSSYFQPDRLLDASPQFDDISQQSYKLVDHNIEVHNNISNTLYTYNIDRRFTYLHTQRFRI